MLNITIPLTKKRDTVQKIGMIIFTNEDIYIITIAVFTLSGDYGKHLNVVFATFT